ncbi:MAG: hypothetical protein KQH57_00940 [Actinomycetales bacterium]|nr:hypothetical protein [Actinomycetales bacterium]
MSPFDDDLSVTDARDEGVIAGRAVASQDAALAQVAAELRAAARADVPEPSAELAALLAHGTAGATVALEAPDRAVEAALAEVVPLRRRRRVLRYVVGGSVAAALALGGTAAAAAVRDGVPVSELPGAIGERIAGAVSDALESVGVRHGDVPTRQADDPQGPGAGTTDQAPGRQGEGPGASDEAPGQQQGGDGPGVSDQAPGHQSGGEGPGVSDQAPGHQDEGPGASDQAPGRDGSGAGSSDQAPGHQDGAPDSSDQPPGDGGSQRSDGQGTDAGTAQSAGASSAARG